MLNINDKVYLHIGDLKKSIDKLGFNKTRLCKIIDIKPARTEAGEEIGVYVLKALFSDKTYKVMSNDNLWCMTSADKLTTIIKQSKYDEETITTIIELIYSA